jgi:rhodanese-related sulfurtransferase
MAEGAVLIDVREEADFDTRHIQGAVHIPLEELSEKLPPLAPDKETKVIFYCAKGMRSQTAVEQALEMEYAYVYTLGAMDNWIYEFE